MGDISHVASLSDEINTATKSLHTILNRLITSRLPLALPPYATDPAPYATGILHFSHIFLTFESLWAELVAAPSSPGAPSSATSPLLSFLLVNPYESPELFSNVVPPSPDMLLFLQNLRPRGLARSSRIKRDLAYLTSMSPTDLEVMLCKYPGDKVAEYCAHIRDTVRRKPHTLIAYAWCFYMAVFSGGRWIRAQLMDAGDDFWRPTDDKASTGEKGTSIPLQQRGLALWNFDGERDGEDIKAEFKRRLADAESLFTADMRADIVEEARQIFIRSASVVEELDAKMNTEMEAVQRIQRLEKRAQEKRASVSAVKSPYSPTAWYQKQGATGAMIALSCLAGVVLLKLAPSVSV